MAGEAEGYAKLALNPRIVKYIDTVLETEVADKCFQKQLKEARNFWKEEGREEHAVSFEFIRSLHAEYNKIKNSDGSVQPLYLHDLLQGSEIVIPSPPQLKRSPELEARLTRLRLEQKEREYQKMVQNVAPERRVPDQLQFGIDMKSSQQQMTVVFNFILTVLGGFVFGYFAGRWLLGWQFTASMILGTGIATAIFYADLYFILKTPAYFEEMFDASLPSHKSHDKSKGSHAKGQLSHDTPRRSHDASKRSHDSSKRTRSIKVT